MLLELEPVGILAFCKSGAYGISEILYAITFEIGISKRGIFFSQQIFF